MGFMDQVKAAANDLKDSVEGSLASGNSARDVERHYRDLGMLTYLQDTGRAIDAADRERIVAALRAAEAAGAMTAFTLQTGAAAAAAAAAGAVRRRRTPASSRRPHRRRRHRHRRRLRPRRRPATPPPPPPPPQPQRLSLPPSAPTPPGLDTAPARLVPRPRGARPA